MLNEARWPNPTLDQSHPVKSTVGGYSNGVIYDNSITQGNGYWTGAYIEIVPGDGWVSYTGQVTNSGPGWISVVLPSSAGSFEQPAAGNSISHSGLQNALQSSGEFFVNSSNQLFVWDQNGDNPNNHDVEIKERQFGFNLSGISNTTIKGINLIACTIETDWGSSSTVLNGITAQYLSQFSNIWNSGWAPPATSGIELSGSNSIIENSVIAYSEGDGVYIGNSNVTVTNNIIHDVDYGGTDAAGVAIYGNTAIITNNTIYNTGRDGINISSGVSGAWVQGNTIHDFMLQTFDGAGVYTVSNTSGGTITGNVMYNAHDNNTDGLIAAGVMLDNNSANWTVSNNITANVDVGFKANDNSYSEQVYGNQLGATQQAIQTNGWTGFQFDWSGTNVYNNVFYNSDVEVGNNANVWGNSYASGSPNIPAPLTSINGSVPPPPTVVASPPPPPPPSAQAVTSSSGSSGTSASDLFGNEVVGSNNLNLNVPAISSNGGVELGLKFQSTIAGYVTGVRFYKSSGDTGTHSGELWSTSGQELATSTFSNESSSGWQQVLFSNPVAIAANTTYIVSYHTTASYITYLPNVLSGSFVTGNLVALSSGSSGGNSVYAFGSSKFPNQYNGQSGSYGLDVLFSKTSSSAAASIFAASAPAGSAQNASVSGGGLSVGLQFQSSTAGSIVGVEFWKGSLNTGTHVADLWTSNGQLLASATFSNESSSGWQQVLFTTPVSINANTTYVVSYFTTASDVSYTGGALSSNVTNGSLTALKGGGVYAYGSSSMFPSQSNGQNGSYWVDPLFEA